MENPEKYNPTENLEKPTNPNTIGELVSLGNKLSTHPDKVYRKVRDVAAVKDLYNFGAVRNKFSAGLMSENRWKDRVFWSRGKEGSFHPVGEGNYVIEVPLSIAEERQVRKEDVTAIYTEKDGNLVNILQSESLEDDSDNDKKTEEITAQKIQEVRNKLGI